MLTVKKEILQKSIAYLEEEQGAKEWLVHMKQEQMVYMIDAVIEGDNKAMEFLLVNKHIVLAAFVNAVWEDAKALRMLMDKKEPIWAAMANIVNGDKGAVAFLQKHKLPTYVKLAQAIQKKIQRNNDKKSSIFSSGPF